MGRELEALRRAAGVTRVARVTGLDRTGIEVACAVRPTGHVLQVSNGKGLSWEDAERGAVMEAVELHAAETVRAASLRWASAEELEAESTFVVRADELGSAGAVADEALSAGAAVFADLETRMAWREGVELLRGGRAFVPAQAVHCPPQGVDLGAVAIGWTTNGMGAHTTSRDAALLHALLEACERDQLARVATEGLDAQLLIERRLAPDARVLPRTLELVRKLEKAGFDVALLDLAPESDEPGALDLPVAGALLVDREAGPIPLTAGYACRLSRDEAFLAAVLEAAQSRLTDIHGAREDITHEGQARREQSLQVAALLRSSGAVRLPSQLPKDVRALTPEAAVSRVLQRIRRAGGEQVVAVDVAEGTVPAQVVKVVVPSFLLSTLLL